MNWTIILSSVAIGSIVAAIISGLLNMLIQDRGYKRDYYKLIISKRITAYQYIETQLNVMKVAVATEGGGYYMMFGNTIINPYGPIKVTLAGIVMLFRKSQY